MSFLNPWLLLGTLGLGLPILAHLLSRYKVQRTDWAAMRFLNRSVRVRSRQLRLRDIALLMLRCLALLLVVLALARPWTAGHDGVAAALGGQRAAVAIALDASFSMQHREGGRTRFDNAIERVGTLLAGVRPGDPVTLVLLGAEHRVIARNVTYDPDRMAELLDTLEPTDGRLDLDSLPRRLKEIAADMKAPRKEIYLVTDMQEQDWAPRADWIGASLQDLAQDAAVVVVPVGDGSENLALEGLELVSGVLRKGTSARYRATVRNHGKAAAEQVRVTGLVNRIAADVKVIPSIAPGAAESVSLLLNFRDTGPARITAALDDDALPADNVRHAVAVIRDKVAVLCVEGSSEGAGDGSGVLIEAALRARGGGGRSEDLEVRTVSWLDLPGQDLSRFDVVVLADVPAIAEEQSLVLERHVRQGGGLIWFAGDQVQIEPWNQRHSPAGTPLLPAVLAEPVRTSDAMAIGRPLDPSMADHPVCRPLLALPEDLLGETRFHRLLRVVPSATSVRVLALAGSEHPVLLEHSLGRGHVFLFTTSAGPAWNNMAVTPVFPMLLQQMVTYLTAREFETPHRVGDSLSLSYPDQPDTTEAVFDTPSGDTVTVPVREHRGAHVAFFEHAREAGFYLARVHLQAEGMPVAVNVDTRESAVRRLPDEDAARILRGTDVRLARSEADLLAAVEEARRSRSWWGLLLLGGAMLLVGESLFAEWLTRRNGAGGSGADA